MPKALGLEFALHDGERGEHDAAHEQPPVLRVDAPLSAAQLEQVFTAHRGEWFAPDLTPYVDNMAAVLAQERALSVQWEGLPGTDHPAHWTGAADCLTRAQPQRRAARRLAVWHLPLAWVMPLVRKRARSLQVRLPLAGSTAALEALALAALPPGWHGHTVRVRLDVETRVYWGARATRQDGQHAWKPCKRRGDGMSHSIELFVFKRGKAVQGTLDSEDIAPMLQRRLAGGVGLLVAVPVLSFEREAPWRQALGRWWHAVWRRIGWVRADDRDPTFVHRMEVDEPVWNRRTGAVPMRPRAWRKALRDGALLRPASTLAAGWQGADARVGDAGSHVMLLHGGLSCTRGTFDALLAAEPGGGGPLWPGMPLLDEVCTWRFEHDTFLPIRHNVQRLAQWLRNEVIHSAATGTLVLLAHSRGGNVARFALPVLRQRFPGWHFSAITAGAPHLGTEVFSRIGRRWTGLAVLVGAVREMTQGWLGREQLAQLVILERGLAYQVPPGFHDVEPDGVRRLADGHPEVLPDGLWLWGSEWGLGDGHHRVEDTLWDWLVEDVGGAEVGGDGLVARHSALGGRSGAAEGAHDASPVFHTRYFAHAPTRGQIAERLARLLGR
ncbi:hypothetical protein [Ideonella sp. BN130291]|uniref:hypothetical protein n=1 Tax=Ideonella sp. BN130291 TaxID=3112940 RepID=UPI002E26BB65|nr:hypothetical protein [Ideonella sp. BN130291]